MKEKEDAGEETQETKDEKELERAFKTLCDDADLVSKEALMNWSEIKELLDAGELGRDEFDEMWGKTAKSPGSQELIDVDGFLSFNVALDDIFEIDDEEGESPIVANVEKVEAKEDVGEDTQETEDEKELERAFKTLCDDAGLVSKEALKNWNEIKEVLDEGELGLDEFDEMWEKTAKSPGSQELIDVDGFLSFNVALDSLFEIVDGDFGSGLPAPGQIAMFYGEDLPAGVIFAEIADENVLVGMEELKKWGDLQDMMTEGDLLLLELQNMFEGIPKAEGSDNKLDEEGFTSLSEAIDELFEDDDEEDADVEPEAVVAAPIDASKDRLLALVKELSMNEEQLPCGLDGTETEVELFLEIASELEKASTNMIRGEEDVQTTDIAGEWELLYTTSSTMKFNKSLTGLVPPNGKFGGLRQKLKASKYLADVEYVEHINAGPTSFDVRVTGDWEIRSTISLFTGLKSVYLDVVPDRVDYGVKSQKADHWKSLGPLTLLDMSYLDKDLRIMRGTTSTESVFVFKRV